MTQAPEDYPAHARLPDDYEGYADEDIEAIEVGETRELTKEFEALLTDNARLKAQLPERMKHCTIVSKECSLGHGWLTATNWVQHGCPTCEKEALRSVIGELVEVLENISEDYNIHGVHETAQQALSRANQSEGK